MPHAIRCLSFDSKQVGYRAVADLGGVGVGGLGGPAAPRSAQVRCRRWVRPRERLIGSGALEEDAALLNEDGTRKNRSSADTVDKELHSSGDHGSTTPNLPGVNINIRSDIQSSDSDSRSGSSSTIHNIGSDQSGSSSSSSRGRFQSTKRLVGVTQRCNDTNNSGDDKDATTAKESDSGEGKGEATTTETSTAIDSGRNDAWVAVDDSGKCTEVVANLSPSAGEVVGSLATGDTEAAAAAAAGAVDPASQERCSKSIVMVPEAPPPPSSSSPSPPSSANASEPTPRKLGQSRRRSLFGSWSSPNKSNDDDIGGNPNASPSSRSNSGSSKNSSSKSSPWSSSKRQSSKLAAAEAEPLSPDVDLAALLLAEHDKAEQLIAAMAAGRQAHKERTSSGDSAEGDDDAGVHGAAACDNEVAS